MATLTAKSRKKLPKSSFALGGGRYPIHDAAHARNALARVAQHGSPREQAIVRAAVKRRYPAIGQAGKKAQIRKAFGAKAKARGTSLSAAQLAVIDLAVDAGYLDLAGKWRHGWIPLDGAALMSKRHGRKGGSLSHYHGGGKSAPQVRNGGLGAHGLGGGSGKASGEGVTPKFERSHTLGKGRAGSSVTSAIQVGKGGRGKSGLSAPKTAAGPSLPKGYKLHAETISPAPGFHQPTGRYNFIDPSGRHHYVGGSEKVAARRAQVHQVATAHAERRRMTVRAARHEGAYPARSGVGRNRPLPQQPKATAEDARLMQKAAALGYPGNERYVNEADLQKLAAGGNPHISEHSVARAKEVLNERGYQNAKARLAGKSPAELAALRPKIEASNLPAHEKAGALRHIREQTASSPPKVDKAGEKRQALNRRAAAHTVPVTRRSKPAAPSQAQRDANLGALEVRKADHGRGYDVVHKPSGKKIGGSHGTQRAAETSRRTIADTHHDLTGNESTITGNPAVMKHIRGSLEQARQAENERASTAAAAARARKTLPSGGGKLTNPSRPGDLAVFSKTHADYQIGKPASSHEEHTPVRLTHVSKEGHALGGYDAAGHYRTIDYRTTTRVLPQDKVDVSAFMEHIKQTNRWHAGSDSVKPHYGSLEETQRAAKQFAKQPSSPPKVDKMSTRGKTGGMTSTAGAQHSDWNSLVAMHKMTPERRAQMAKNIERSNTAHLAEAQKHLTVGQKVTTGGGVPHAATVEGFTSNGQVKVKFTESGRTAVLHHNSVLGEGEHADVKDLPTKQLRNVIGTGNTRRELAASIELHHRASQPTAASRAAERRIAEVNAKLTAEKAALKPSAPASHITAQEEAKLAAARKRSNIWSGSDRPVSDHALMVSVLGSKRADEITGASAPSPASHITAQEAFRMSKADLQVKADKGDPVASAELRRRAAKTTAPKAEKVATKLRSADPGAMMRGVHTETYKGNRVSVRRNPRGGMDVSINGQSLVTTYDGTNGAAVRHLEQAKRTIDDIHARPANYTNGQGEVSFGVKIPKKH